MSIIESELSDEDEKEKPFDEWMTGGEQHSRQTTLPTGREPKKDTPSLQHILAESTTILIRDGKIAFSGICETSNISRLDIVQLILPRLAEYLTPNDLCEILLESRELGQYIVLEPSAKPLQPLVEEQKNKLTGFVTQRVIPLLQFLNDAPNPAEKIRQKITPAMLQKNGGVDAISFNRQKLFWVLIEACYFEQKTNKQILENLDIPIDEAGPIRQLFSLITTADESQPLYLHELQKVLCINYSLFKKAFVPAATQA